MSWGNYRFQSHSEFRSFLATSSYTSLNSMFLQKIPRIKKARKEKDKGMQLFLTTNQFTVVWFLKEKENDLKKFQSCIE